MKNAIGFDHRGPRLGPSALLQKTPSGWTPLASPDLAAICMTTFGQDIEETRLIAGLSTVAKALNAGDIALTAIATCLLPLPSETANEVDDLAKASPDDPDHPGWPKGTSNGKGGQFRPKDGANGADASERSKRLQKLAARRSVRSIMIRILTMKRLAQDAWLAAGELVPGLEAIDTLPLIKQVADITAEFLAEDKAAGVALEFIKHGSHTFEEIAVGKEVESFSSFDAFKKVDLEKRFGPAGEGYEYHHIVEQGANRGLIPADRLNSTTNIVRISKLLHEEVNGIYSRGPDVQLPNGSLRDVLKGQSFETQYEHGLEVLRRIGVLQ